MGAPPYTQPPLASVAFNKAYKKHATATQCVAKGSGSGSKRCTNRCYCDLKADDRAEADELRRELLEDFGKLEHARRRRMAQVLAGLKLCQAHQDRVVEVGDRMLEQLYAANKVEMPGRAQPDEHEAEEPDPGPVPEGQLRTPAQKKTVNKSATAHPASQAGREKRTVTGPATSHPLAWPANVPLEARFAGLRPFVTPETAAQAAAEASPAPPRPRTRTRTQSPVRPAGLTKGQRLYFRPPSETSVSSSQTLGRDKPVSLAERVKQLERENAALREQVREAQEDATAWRRKFGRLTRSLRRLTGAAEAVRNGETGGKSHWHSERSSNEDVRENGEDENQ